MEVLSAPKHIVFKTLSKNNVVILQNPAIQVDRFKTGNKKGRVKSKTRIRFCEDFDTIDIVEQNKIDPKARASSLFMRKGVYVATEDDIALVDFLRNTEQNEANGGRLFKEVDITTDELYEIEGFEALDKAIRALMDGSDSLVRAVAMWFVSPTSVHTPVNTLKLRLRKKLQADDVFVTELNKFIEEDSSDEKLMISIALTEGIIEVTDGKRIVWKDSGESIYLSPQAQDVIRNFAIWLKNDEEGREYSKAIAQKLKK